MCTSCTTDCIGQNIFEFTSKADTTHAQQAKMKNILTARRLPLHVVLLLLVALTASPSSCASSSSAHATATGEAGFSPAKPSFLFMLIDDVGWADFSYNNGTARTPNIDSWSRRSGSIILQDFHSGGAVCSPTRATVLTGRSHFRDCVDTVYACPDMSSCMPDFEFAPSRTFTVGDALRSAGPDYEGGAYFAGKWHLGSFYNDSEAYGGRTSSPITHGFHRMHATLERGPTETLNCMCRAEWSTNCNLGHYYDPPKHYCRGGKECCFNYWWDDPMAPHGVTNLTRPTPADDALYLADAFSRFLAERGRREKPFLAQISFHNCHVPFVASEGAKAACIRGETCLPAPAGGTPYTEEELDYYACLTSLDNAVGKVLDALVRGGYYDNTMVWFASDNGPEKNCPPDGFCEKADADPQRPEEAAGTAGPLRGRKRDVYEGGHRVPGIVSFPAMVRGKGASWETVVTMDFLPTVMEILGVDRPPEQRPWPLDGRSILPLLRSHEEFRWKDTPDGNRGIGIGYYDRKLKGMNGWGYRYGRWKYVEGSFSCTGRHRACQKPQLFDLERDLGERHDLSAERPDILAELQEKFLVWHGSIVRSRQSESRCKQAGQLDLPQTLMSSQLAIERCRTMKWRICPKCKKNICKRWVSRRCNSKRQCRRKIKRNMRTCMNREATKYRRKCKQPRLRINAQARRCGVPDCVTDPAG